MNNPFEMRDCEAHITGAVIIDAGRFAGIGVGLPEGLGDESQEKADLLERRLLKLEAEMERRNQVDEEIRLHAVQMREFIESFSAADPK